MRNFYIQVDKGVFLFGDPRKQLWPAANEATRGVDEHNVRIARPFEPTHPMCFGGILLAFTLFDAVAYATWCRPNLSI